MSTTQRNPEDTMVKQLPPLAEGTPVPQTTDAPVRRTPARTAKTAKGKTATIGARGGRMGRPAGTANKTPTVRKPVARRSTGTLSGGLAEIQSFFNGLDTEGTTATLTVGRRTLSARSLQDLLARFGV